MSRIGVLLIARAHLRHRRGDTFTAVFGLLLGLTAILILLEVQAALRDCPVGWLRRLDADLVLVRLDAPPFGDGLNKFPSRLLDRARRCEGVSSAVRLDVEWSRAIWKDPRTGQARLVRVLAFDPGKPVLLGADVREQARKLEAPGAALLDRSSGGLGPIVDGMRGELSGHPIEIVGLVDLGTDCHIPGSLLLSDATQAAIFGEGSREAATLGLIRVASGASPETVRQRLGADLSDEAAVLDKDDLLERERTGWQRHDPFLRLLEAGGPALTIVCGLFCWWLLFRLQQPHRRDFAILRLTGYERSFMLRLLAAEVTLVVLQAGVPAIIVAFCLQPVLRYWTGLPVSFYLGQASLWLAASACVFVLLAVARGLRWQRSIDQDLQSCL